MRTLTIRPGLTLRGKYLIAVCDSGALNLASYDYQVQILDSSFGFLTLATTTADETEDGKIWLSMTASETSSLSDTAKYYVLLIRHKDDGWVEASELGVINLGDEIAWNS